MYVSDLVRDFLEFFSSRATDFHGREKLFEQNFFTRKFSIDGQTRQAKSLSQLPVNSACCSACNETPVWLNLACEALQPKYVLFLFFFVTPILRYFKSFKPIMFFSHKITNTVPENMHTPTTELKLSGEGVCKTKNI